MSGIDELFDESNSNALSQWVDMYHGNPNFKMVVETKEPISIVFDNENDYNKFLFLLNKYRIEYNEFKPSEN